MSCNKTFVGIIAITAFNSLGVEGATAEGWEFENIPNPQLKVQTNRVVELGDTGNTPRSDEAFTDQSSMSSGFSILKPPTLGYRRSGSGQYLHNRMSPMKRRESDGSVPWALQIPLIKRRGEESSPAVGGDDISATSSISQDSLSPSFQKKRNSLLMIDIPSPSLGGPLGGNPVSGRFSVDSGSVDGPADGGSSHDPLDGDPEADRQYSDLADYIQEALDHPDDLISLLPFPEDPVWSVVNKAFSVPWFPEEVDFLSPAIRPLYDFQMKEDQMFWFTAPYPLYDSEIYRDGTRFHLSRLISRRPDAILFTTNLLIGDQATIIKYQYDCGTGNQHPLLRDDVLHSLMRDYWLQQIAAQVGICAHVYHLSPPVPIPEFMTPKFDFRINLDEYRRCGAGPVASVRYMVMEQIPLTALDLMDRKEATVSSLERFSDGLDLLISLIPKLKRMHDLGIIHGDLHPGNVARLNSSGKKDYGLIDFGRAFFNDEYSDKPKRSGYLKEQYRIHCFVSYFYMEGYRYGFRDDMLNLLMVGAFVMSGAPLFDLCTNLKNNANGLHMFYRNFNTFAFNSLVDPALPMLLKWQKDAVTDFLHLALLKSRSVWDVTQRPDYDAIMSLIVSAKQILSAGQKTRADEKFNKSHASVVQQLERAQPKLQLQARKNSRTLVTEVFTQSNVIPALSGCEMPGPQVTLSDGSLTEFSASCGSDLLNHFTAEPDCASDRAAFHIASDFEVKLRLVFKTGVFSRLKAMDYNGSRHGCGHHVVFTQPPLPHLMYRGLVQFTPKLLASLARSAIALVEIIHTWGAVLGEEPLLNVLTLDKTHTELRLWTVPKSFEMFVDPLTSRHVMACNEAYTDACFSRARDFVELSVLFDFLLPERTEENATLSAAFNEFGQYVKSLKSFESPDYAAWSSRFKAISDSIN